MSTPLTNIVTVADVDARLSSQARTRLFAKSGGSTVDLAFQSLCVAEANSRIRTITRSAFPDGLYVVGDTLDAEVVGRGVDLVIAIAASRHLATDETSGYARLGVQARDFFMALNRNADAQAAGSTTSPPLPRATIRNRYASDGQPTNVYTQQADGTEGTGY
jgi:hypothetical protein